MEEAEDVPLFCVMMSLKNVLLLEMDFGLQLKVDYQSAIGLVSGNVDS
jgi:hypothetical protein